MGKTLVNCRSSGLTVFVPTIPLWGSSFHAQRNVVHFFVSHFCEDRKGLQYCPFLSGLILIRIFMVLGEHTSFLHVV